MYTVSVTRSFTAWHYLIGADFGPENELNSHEFGITVTVDGPELDELGFLVNIDAIRAALDDVESRFANATLNNQPGFEGLNPSVERFAHVLWDFIAARIPTESLNQMRVTVQEDDDASASFVREFSA